MHKMSLLFLLMALVSACGRDPANLYRAYDINPLQDQEGHVLPDLASQNRQSLQTNGEYQYFYVPPSQDSDSTNSDGSEQSDSQTQDSQSSSDSDAALPDDAPAAPSSPSSDPLAAAKAKLAALSDTLDNLIAGQKKN